MSSSFFAFCGTQSIWDITNPYVAGIVSQLTAGDSSVWNDVPFIDANGNGYDSTGYTLKYVIAGPIPAPLIIQAVASGNGWQTTLTTTDSATLVAGLYSWKAQIFATGVRFTLDEGELTVEADLILAGANYDGRSQAEIALANAREALAVFQSSGGRIQHYTIGSRSMSFQKDSDILAVVNFWKAEVDKEKMIANPRRRFINVRLDRTR